MAVQTVENIQRLPPFLEGLQKRLLQTGFGEFDGETQTTPGLLDSPLDLPQFQIAGIDPLRERAITLGENLVGSFKPFVEGARDQALAGQQALTSGLQFLQPEAIQQFQNPFQQQVIDRTMAELDRQADIRRAGADAAAVRSGAFSGSRQGVQRAEAERGLQQVKGDTLSRLLSQGFSSALQAAQNAGRLSGGLGQAFGTLAGTTGDIGRLQQALGQADISQLTQLGALRQGQSQAELDAQRQNLLQSAQEPFTRLQLGQNLLQGMPSASIPSTFQQATSPGANPFLQGIGAYTTLSQIAPFGGGKSTWGRNMAPKQTLSQGLINQLVPRSSLGKDFTTKFNQLRDDQQEALNILGFKDYTGALGSGDAETFLGKEALIGAESLMNIPSAFGKIYQGLSLPFQAGEAGVTALLKSLVDPLQTQKGREKAAKKMAVDTSGLELGLPIDTTVPRGQLGPNPIIGQTLKEREDTLRNLRERKSEIDEFAIGTGKDETAKTTEGADVTSSPKFTDPEAEAAKKAQDQKDAMETAGDEDLDYTDTYTEEELKAVNDPEVKKKSCTS